MVFQWFPYDNQEAFDKVAVSFSEDDGFSWTAPCLIKVNGLPEEYMRPFDPTIVTLSDGFFRLYFTSQPYPYRQPLIYSAVSQDAINYTFEPGVRSVDAQGSVVDCSVIRVADVWHLYAHYQPGPDMQQGGPIIMRAYHAVSDDGIDFEAVKGFDLPQGKSWIGNIIQLSEGLRFYGSGSRGVWSSFSSDGYEWKVEPGNRADGGDPSVFFTKDGRYGMVAVGQPREDASESPFVLR